MREIKMTGYATVTTEAYTVGELRELVKYLDKYHVSDDARLDWGSGRVYVELTESAKVTWIECGDHRRGDEKYDVLIETHEHKD